MNESFKHFFLFCFHCFLHWITFNGTHKTQIIRISVVFYENLWHFLLMFRQKSELFLFRVNFRWIIFSLIALLVLCVCVCIWIIYLIVLENYPLLIYFGNSCFNCVAERALRNFPPTKQHFQFLHSSKAIFLWKISDFCSGEMGVGFYTSILLYYIITYSFLLYLSWCGKQ